MALFYRGSPPTQGYLQMAAPATSPTRWIELGLLNLEGDQTWQAPEDDQETVVLIMGGRCRISSEAGDWRDLGQRENVFAGKATAAYFPPGFAFSVQAAGPVEIAVCRAPATCGPSPTLVRPDEVNVRVVGADNWQRDVHDVVVNQVGAHRLLVGETYNPSGNWSSYPPHKHDVDELPDESELEEVYHFRLDPPQGFGVQRLYTEDGEIDEAHTLRDRDTVVIPKGFHPVVAAPGYRLYYLWVLAGEKRVMAPRDDPAHSWMKEGPRD
jgi:5-deoxy-glucuronate isomerase